MYFIVIYTDEEGTPWREMFSSHKNALDFIRDVIPEERHSKCYLIFGAFLYWTMCTGSDHNDLEGA